MFVGLRISGSTAFLSMAFHRHANKLPRGNAARKISIQRIAGRNPGFWKSDPKRSKQTNSATNASACVAGN
jgi:hypothetical protein